MFQHSVDLQVVPEKALDRARVLLIYAGLNVTVTGRDELTFKGPGMRQKFMGPQNILALITNGHLCIVAGRLEFEAELGGLKYIQRITNGLVIGLTLIVSLAMYFTGEFSRDPTAIFAPIVLTVLWLAVILPMSFWMGRMIKNDIRRALETIAAQ